MTRFSCKILISLLLISAGANGQIDVKFHFSLGQGTAVTYAAGPALIVSDNASELKILRHSAPVFFASSPDGKTGGAILFTPENGFYHSDQSWFST